MAPSCGRASPRGITQGGQGLDYRLRVDLPHQSADVLPLSGTGAAARDDARLADGVGEPFRQPERVELRVRELDQLLPNPLDGERFPLACALARPRLAARRLVGLGIVTSLRSHCLLASRAGSPGFGSRGCYNRVLAFPRVTGSAYAAGSRRIADPRAIKCRPARPRGGAALRREP